MRVVYNANCTLPLNELQMLQPNNMMEQAQCNTKIRAWGGKPNTAIRVSNWRPSQWKVSNARILRVHGSGADQIQMSMR